MEAILAEITNELMFEALKKIQHDLSNMKMSMGEIRGELVAIRGTLYSMSGDIMNIYTKLARHDVQLERIENRLELRKMAEAKAKFEHAT